MSLSPTDNLLLGALPSEEYRRIAGDLKREEFSLGRAVLPAGDQLDRFYFVASGIVSLLYTTEDDESAEIALVGREGGIGLGVVLGRRSSPVNAVVQAPCVTFSLHKEALQREFQRGGALQQHLLEFTQALMTQMAHTVVCNRHHSIYLQLCRWILLSLDRLPTAELQMTQEMIANMLGVRRAGVNEATGLIEDEGLITHSRGRIAVRDRAGLEARACECYRNIRAEYAALEESLTGESAQQKPAT